jgi:hypothetical protein
MDNKTYLYVSYFAVSGVCLCLGLVAWFWMKGPLQGIARAMPQKKWEGLLRRAFPLSTILFVLSACLSVNYYDGCNPISYDKIVENRDYIISKNLEQVSQSLDAIVWSISLWAFIVAVCLFAIQRGKAKQNTGEGS